MSELHYKYLVALSESTSAEDLESLLNEKAREGYELFMLHEVDSRTGEPQYHCIFYKMEETATGSGENVEIFDITDFKSRMEKMYQSRDAHKEYLDLKQKVISTHNQIQETKKALEATDDEQKRNELNDKIQEKINEQNELNAQLSKISDSYKFYNRIKSDKIILYLSDELLNLAEEEGEDNLIARNIQLRQEITEKLGYVIPNIKYSDSQNLEPYQYRIDIRDVPAAQGFVYPDHRMFFKGQSNINRKPAGAISSIHPVFLFDVFWVKEDKTKDFWDQGLSPSDVISLHLSYTAIKHALDLLDYKDIYKYIDIVRKSNLELSESLVPDVITAGDLRYILANLIKEMVPIKDITNIFEKVMDLYSFATEKEMILEKLRVTLKRQITYSKADENNKAYSIIIDPGLDDYLKDNIITPDYSDPFISLTKTAIEQLMTKTAKIIEDNNIRIENTFILTSTATRQPLFQLYEEYIPGLSVLAHEELSNEVEIEEIETIDKKVFPRTKRNT